MGVGLFAWIALAEASLAASSPAIPSFSEAWYREVVMGEVFPAGELYQRIYEDGAAALSKGGPLPEVHRRAALRAGSCFEKVGRGDLAREAYSWLVRAGPADDPSVRYAQLRLVSIAGGGAGADAAPAGSSPAPEARPSELSPPIAALAPAGAPAAGPARPEGFPALDRFRQRVERRESCAGELRREVGNLNQRVQQETRLRQRLADLGVEMQVEVGGIPSREGSKESKDRTASPIAEALRTLDPEDRSLLSLALAERYYFRGLRALRDRDPAQAAEEFQKVLEFQPDYRDAFDLLGTSRGFLRPMEGVAKLAAQRLFERGPDRELQAVRTMRGALARADLLIAQDQAQSALPELERARSEEEWLPPRILRAAEIGALGREADIRSLLISYPPPGAPASGPGVERYEVLRASGRQATSDLTGLAEDLTDLFWQSSDRRRRVAGKEDRKDESEAQRRVREELERLLVRGQDKYRLKPQDDRSQDGWRREFQDLKILAQWFPESDKDQRLRKLAQEYLER